MCGERKQDDLENLSMEEYLYRRQKIKKETNQTPEQKEKKFCLFVAELFV